MPIGTAPVMPDELAGGAATIAQQPVMPAGNPPVAAVQKPSLFMRILSGALLGMGAGMAAERPEQGFAAGWGAVQSARDKQLQQQLMMQQSQREQQRVGMEQQQVNQGQQRVDIERQQVANQKILIDAQASAAMVSKLHTEKLIDLLPVEEQRKQLQAWSQAMSMTGLQPVLEINEADRTNYLQQMQAEGKKLTDYTFGPSLTPGKITVYQADPTKKMTEENATKLSSALGMKIPAGIPVALADSMIRETMQARSAYAVASLGYQKALEIARIQAGQRVSPAAVKQMTDLDNQEAQYATLLAMFDEKARMTKTGEVTSHPWVGGLMAQGRGVLMGKGAIGGRIREMTNAIDVKEAAFRTFSQQVRALKVHENYGGAVTPNELKLAMTWIPELSMAPTQFRQAIMNQISLTQAAKQHLLANMPGLQGETIPKATEKTIGVRIKADGRIGDIPESQFDPKIYEKL